MVDFAQEGQYARFEFDDPGLTTFLKNAAENGKTTYSIRFNKGAFRLYSSNASKTVKATAFTGEENFKFPFQIPRIDIDAENSVGKMLVIEIIFPNTPRGGTMISTSLIT